MSQEPRHSEDYSLRQVAAARRALIDIGQVLASFNDCFVVVGGWVPDLRLPDADEPHIGSIDVDLALDTVKLADGRYSKMLEALLNTGRYKQSDEPFKLYTEVDLKDGRKKIRVDVDFLKSPDTKTKKNKPKLTKGFRPLDATGCDAAFENPELLLIPGEMITGSTNKVRLQVASIPDFLIMKCYALDKRDKPKDAYDICYCLDHYPDGMLALAENWKGRTRKKNVAAATGILKEKFETVVSYGPMQVVEFHNSSKEEEREQQARRAYELIQKFLELLS